MAKVNNPNDHELWLELLQIKPSRKGSNDEQRINEIIDRYLADGLEFRDDPYTGLTNALSTLRKKSRRARVIKKVLSIILIVLAVGGLIWGGYKLFNEWNGKQVAQELTQTAGSVTLYRTVEAKKTISFQETSTAWAELNPTQTNTPLPTPTETPPPAPAPLQFPSTIAMGTCNETECRWDFETPINAGFYALFILKDMQGTDVISDNPGKIYIDTTNPLTIDLRQCVGLDKGERCFVGLLDLTEPQSSIAGRSENLVNEIMAEVNLEFFQVSQLGETLGNVIDFLLPKTEIVDLPLCQNGECIIFGSYRPSRQIAAGSEFRLLPSQPIEGINIYYFSPGQAPDQIFTPLLLNPSGWIFNETPVDGGFFVFTLPFGNELSEQIVLLVINPIIPEVQQ